MGYQVWVHLGDLLGHEAELRDARLIQLGLVMEGDGTQGQERVTDSAHVGDVRLEPTRGEKHAKLASVVHVAGASASANGLAGDASDVGSAVKNVANANGAAVVARSLVTNVNVVAPGGDIVSCRLAEGGIEAAGGVRTERGITNGRVVVADGVGVERPDAGAGVQVARGVESERLETEGGVIGAHILQERVYAAGGVVVAEGVIVESWTP